MIKRWIPSYAVFGAFGAASVLVSPVLAQTTAGPSGQDLASSTQLQEVVVTAQKRSENLQNVPITVTALTANALADANITDATDLGQLSASLNILQATGILEPMMRGIGNPDHVIGNEASVPIYVDGVYMAHLASSEFEFNDIERIEVLAGPQGTLFGRNASAGAISIITKDPTQETQLHLEEGYGSFETETAKIFASTGVTDQLSGDIAMQLRQQGEGWGRNLTTGAPAGYEDHDAVHTKWLYQPTADTQIRLSANYSQSKGDIGNPMTPAQGTGEGTTTVKGHLVPPVSGFYNTTDAYDAYAGDHIWGVSGRIDHQFAAFSVMSLTAYQNTHGTSTLDLGFNPQPTGDADLDYNATQFSEELQVLSPKDSPIQWVAGFYAMDELQGYNALTENGASIGPPGYQVQIWANQRTQSYAGFGQATMPIIDDSNHVTMGIRYTYDLLDAGGRINLATPGPLLTLSPQNYADKKFMKSTYRISFDHHFTEGVMAYISASTGFKDGTYNLLPFGPNPAEPEEVSNYEIGAKAELFDRRLRINGSLFYDQLHNPQVQETLFSLTTFVNAGGAEVKGLDLDVTGKLAEHLTTHAGFQYLTSIYTSFSNAPISFPNPNPPYGTTPYVPFNAAGWGLPNAPHETFNVGFDYALPTYGYGTGNFSLNYAYNSGFWTQPDHEYFQKSFGILDGQVRWRTPDSRWAITLWGKNLTGAQYYAVVNEDPGPTGFPSAAAAPRTYGLTLSYDM